MQGYGALKPDTLYHVLLAHSMVERTLISMAEDVRWVKTHCARLDHGGCALLVGVRNERIVKIKGDPEGHLNRGYVCYKGLASADRLNHPSRLKHPLKRVGQRGRGNWERISWEEAIETISANLDGIRSKHGARAVAFCQGMPKGMEHFALIRLANIFGTPNVVGTQDVCHAPREITGVHTCGFYPVADFHERSRLAVLWGSNITSTNEEGEICSLLLNQMKTGTEIMVVDPRRTVLVPRAKLWLQLRPGTDDALALAFLNVIIEEGLYDKAFVASWTHGFDRLAAHVKSFTPEKASQRTWVPPDMIRQGARLYAGSRPASIQWGNAVEQSSTTFDISRALVSLMALCGNLDVPGGNIKANEPKMLPLGKFVRADLLPGKPKAMINAAHGTIPRLMTVPPSLLKKAILEDFPYPVRGAYMQGTNPLVAYAQSPQTFDALNKLDFLAVADLFMTPTAALADVVLPAATHFEFNDIGHCGLGHGVLLARPRVVPPPGECWPDIKILNALGRALTPEEYWYADYEELLNVLLEPSGCDYTEFAERGLLKGEALFRKYQAGGFKTPSGKVELVLSQAEKWGLPPLPRCRDLEGPEDPEYPLVLTSRKSRYYLHSSYRWVESLRRKNPRPKVEIHPDTAMDCGIREGDDVVIETRRGSVTQVAHLTDTIHPRTVYAAYGWWFPEAGAESQYGWTLSNYNMLTSAETIGKEFGTPDLKGIGCRIRAKAARKE
jgi:anaerobic selenocysteine-containing dehydrogenase